MSRSSHRKESGQKQHRMFEGEASILGMGGVMNSKSLGNPGHDLGLLFGSKGKLGKSVVDGTDSSLSFDEAAPSKKSSKRHHHHKDDEGDKDKHRHHHKKHHHHSEEPEKKKKHHRSEKSSSVRHHAEKEAVAVPVKHQPQQKPNTNQWYRDMMGEAYKATQQAHAPASTKSHGAAAAQQRHHQHQQQVGQGVPVQTGVNGKVMEYKIFIENEAASKALQHASDRTKDHQGKHVNISRYGFCGSCHNVFGNCACEDRDKTFIGAIDGHPNCPAKYLVSAVYGTVATSVLDWTLTSAGTNSYILAPLPPATIAGLRTHFGFTDPAVTNPVNQVQTHVGEMVLFAGYTGVNESVNGMYMITAISATQYRLHKVDFDTDKCYKIGVGDYLRIRFGTDAAIYEIIAKGQCESNILDVEATEYTTYSMAVEVYPVAQCCNPGC